MAIVGLALAVRSYPGTAFSDGLTMRLELAFGYPNWAWHAEIASRVAARSPRRAERMLRSGLAKGGVYDYPPLAALLRAQAVARRPSGCGAGCTRAWPSGGR